MTPEQFEQKLRQNREALKQAIWRTIPVKMGNAAERHFKDNFRKGGFMKKENVVLYISSRGIKIPPCRRAVP